MVSRGGSKWITALGPVCLLLGFAVGAWMHGTPAAEGWTGFFDPIGALWTNALRVTVIPLSVSLIVSGIAAAPSSGAVGRWGAAAVTSFVGILVAGAIFAIAIAAVYVPNFGPARLTLPTSRTAQGTAGPGFGDWLQNLIPGNLIEAASKGDLLPVAVAALLFALAVRQLGDAQRKPIVDFFSAIRDALLVYVRWVVLFLPLGAFALAFGFAAESGGSIAGATLHYVVYSCAVLLAFTGVLYLIVLILTRIGIVRFAKAAGPAQAVAIGTRSSLASLPMIVEGAKRLELPEEASGIVVPLAGAIFKPNRTISPVCKLFFVAAVFGVALDPVKMLAFVLTLMLLSFSTPGIPSGSNGSTFGAYLAAGLPAEGVLLFDAVDSLKDIFRTLVNVTGSLAAATIATRFARPALLSNSKEEAPAWSSS